MYEMIPPFPFITYNHKNKLQRALTVEISESRQFVYWKMLIVPLKLYSGYEMGVIPPYYLGYLESYYP